MSEASRGERNGDRFSRLCLLVAVLVVYPRLYFGLSFFDEPYYLALPYGFSLGDRPFLDENAVHQLAGLLTWPAVEIYLAVTGSSDGIVLFARHLYFVAALATVLLVRGVWRDLAGERAANLLAAIALSYVPLCLFALSYDTFLSLGLLAGTACLARACLGSRGGREGGRARALALGTAFLAVAAFAYPSAIPALALTIGMALAVVSKECPADERRAVAVATLGTAALCVALGGALLLDLHLPDAIEPMLEFSRAQGAQGGGAAKLKAIGLELRFQAAFLLALGAGVVPGTLAMLRGRARWIVALLTAPWLFAASVLYRDYHAPFTTVPFVLSALGLAAPWVLVSQRRELGRERGLALGIVIAASCLAGATILWSSANGLRNLALGLTPAALASLGMSIRRDEARLRNARGISPACAVAASLLAFQLFQLWSHAYREFPPAQLDAQVSHGAWSGIRTTSRKVAFLTELSHDLAAARGDAANILVFDYFPAGYLLSDLTPATPGLWMFPVSRLFQGTMALRNVYASRLAQRPALPDIVVRMRCIPARPFTTLPSIAADPVVALFAGGEHEIAVDRPCYRILRRRSAGTSP